MRMIQIASLFFPIITMDFLTRIMNTRPRRPSRGHSPLRAAVAAFLLLVLVVPSSTRGAGTGGGGGGCYRNSAALIPSPSPRTLHRTAITTSPPTVRITPNANPSNPSRLWFALSTPGVRHDDHTCFVLVRSRNDDDSDTDESLFSAAHHPQDEPDDDNEAGAAVNRRLEEVATRLKLEVFDLDGGLYGYESKDHLFGIEVVRTTIVPDANQGLGLVLTEVAGSAADGRGLVLVSQVGGAASRAIPPIGVGDALTGVSCGSVRARTTGLNYDGTVEAIGEAKANLGSDAPGITLELNRLVRRAEVQVVVEEPGQSTRTIPALAGENLRRLLLRKGIQLYDPASTRFDMPFARGDCAGEGLCGTCLVDVREGGELLNPPGDQEKLITRGRPISWRASCRAVVGADNQPGTLRIRTRPQSAFSDELNPGVRSLKRH